MFSVNMQTDKILSYKFGGDFNSSLEVFSKRGERIFQVSGGGRNHK